MARLSASGISDVLFQLVDIEQRSQAQGDWVPAVNLDVQGWQGLAFMLDGMHVVAAMDEVRELIPYPESVTLVAGAKAWVVGLANVRGDILPIIDLQQFIGGEPVVANKKSRVLVIRNRGASTGLLVPTVRGMHHLPVDKLLRNAGFEGTMEKYIYDIFELEDYLWPVFSMAALFNDDEFRSAVA